MYSTLLQSGVKHCHAELSSDVFGNHYNDTLLTRGWQALSSHSCSWTCGAFILFPLKSLRTFHGIVFTERGHQIFLSLMLWLTANTHSYRLFTYVINVFMFHRKSNCFSRGDTKVVFLTSSNSPPPGGGNSMPQVVTPSGYSFELISSVSCFSWGFSLGAGEKEDGTSAQLR